MDDILYECIKALNSNNTQGYSFVRSFVNVLWRNRKTLNIDDCSIVWKVNFDNGVGPRIFIDYVSNNINGTNGIEFNRLFNSSHPLTSDDNTIDNYINWKTACHDYYIMIPINGNSKNEKFFSTYGLIILSSSNGKIKINSKELDLFHLILNQRVPNVLCEELSIEALGDIAKTEAHSHNVYSGCFASIGHALDTIAAKGSILSEKCGLKHFSLWNYFIPSKLITKQFSRNTYNDKAHNKTHVLLINAESHYLNDAFKENNEEKDVHILKCYDYNMVRHSFEDEDYFRSIGLNENNTTVIVAISNNLHQHNPDRILNYYVTDIVNSPFISKLFVETLTRSIVNVVNKCLVTARDGILSKLMTFAMNYPDEHEFYQYAKGILLESNEAEDVIIYMNDNGLYECKTHKIKNNFDGNLIFPDQYAVDLKFSKWAEGAIKKHKSSFFIGDSVVSSAMILRSMINEYKECVIILINKRHIPSTPSVYYNNMFDKDSIFLTKQSGVFLLQYQRMQDSINNKNYLLHKLRHEIPSCTEAIEQCASDIKQAISEIDISRANINNIVSNIELHNSRVLLLAKFFSTVDFDNSQFVLEKKKINLRTFLSSCIETFRTEGKFRGVDVYFEMKEDIDVTLQVSNFFQLAIVNIITNAVRYSACGTCVRINLYNDRIEIRDVGIGISDEEKKYIFKEGYRGDKAKRTSEKGMGYGLYLTKKVLDAYEMEISVSSSVYRNKNYNAQYAVIRYLNTLDDKKRKEFIYCQLDDINKHVADELYAEIKETEKFMSPADRYTNLRIETIKNWLDYLKGNNVVFVDMTDFFDEIIYEVVFTIKIK